jgi:hypothetical protein
MSGFRDFLRSMMAPFHVDGMPRRRVFGIDMRLLSYVPGAPQLAVGTTN